MVTQWVPEQFASVGPSHKLQVACSSLQLMHSLPRTPDVRFAIFVPRQGHVGTLNYRPLEILLGGSDLSPAFDVWGGGLL